MEENTCIIINSRRNPDCIKTFRAASGSVDINQVRFVFVLDTYISVSNERLLYTILQADSGNKEAASFLLLFVYLSVSLPFSLTYTGAHTHTHITHT